MAKKSLRTKLRAFKRWQHRNSSKIITLILIAFAGVFIYIQYMQNNRLSVDNSSYRPLLELIARAESNDNYNAYYGAPENKSVDFTSMTIAGVLDWQHNHVKQGNPSSAVGRYQIINTTLAEISQQLGIKHSQKFNQATQDKLAIALIERRGVIDYINQQISREQFAANLSQEWAGLPRVIGSNPEASYYAGDGLNTARVSVEETTTAINLLRAKQ